MRGIVGVLAAQCVAQGLAAVTSITHSYEFKGANTKRATLYKVSGTDPTFEFSSAADNVLVYQQGGGRELRSTAAVKESGDGHVTYSVDVNPAKRTNGVATFVVETKGAYEIQPREKNAPQTAERIGYSWEDDLCSSLLQDVKTVYSKDLESVALSLKLVNGKLADITVPEPFSKDKSAGTSASLSLTGNAAIESALSKCSTGGASTLGVVFETSDSTPVIKTLDRDVTVNLVLDEISVTEAIDLRNGGPALRGLFSRIEEMKAAMFNAPSPMQIRSLRVALPPLARDIRLYDKTGIVSTLSIKAPSARANKAASKVNVDIEPRYPVTGDWKYEFSLSYTVPAARYLKKQDDGQYILDIPPLTLPDNVAVQSDTVNIRLPTLSSDTHVLNPQRNVNESVPAACVSEPMYLNTGCQLGLSLPGHGNANLLRVAFRATPVLQAFGLVNILVFAALTFVSVKILLRLVK